jgi:signal transduction histidine kinase
MSERPGDAPTQKGLGAVAGGLVHEIRNPLSTMNVTLQLLQEDFPEGSEDPQGVRTARRLKALLGEVRRLEEILDDFLRYAGIRRLALAPMDLNRILEEVTAFMMPECARVGVVLSVYPDRSLPIIRLDERLVKQALLNLLLNALQAMEGEEDAEGKDRQLIARTRLVGSGLGLPTARRIAEEHGGSLEVESEPGKGSDFILRLPLAGPPRGPLDDA